MLPYIRNPRQNGFVLLLVLIFLQIFTLMSLSSLRQILMHVKLLGAIWQRQELTINAENLLSDIENQLKNSKPICIIRPISTTKIIQAPAQWWAAKSCVGNFKTFKYYYVIEFLGHDPCSFILSNNKRDTKKNAYFYRISLLMKRGYTNNISHAPRVIMQSIFLKGGELTETCKLMPRFQSEGRKEWNELV